MKVVARCSGEAPKAPTFGDLKVGDAFLYCDHDYIKIVPINRVTGGKVNLVMPSTGQVGELMDDTLVTPLPNALFVRNQ